MSNRKNRKYGVASRLIHGRDRSEAWEYGHHLVPPISTSATFRLDSTRRGALAFQEYADADRTDHHIYIYDRLREPNKDLLEEELADAEGGEMAVTFATGMGAISAALTVLSGAGKHVITHRTLYGCTHSLLRNWFPHLGISFDETDMTRLDLLKRLVRTETRVIYFETPANPNLELIDIRAIADLVEEENRSRSDEDRIYIVVDNTFATPYCQRPLEYGADFVVHSLTKGIGGFGTDMGGVVIGPERYRPLLLLYRKDFGGVLSPRAAWSVLVHGLPTLPLRMRRMQESAQKVAGFLQEHPLVEKVRYPGLSTQADYRVAKTQMRDFDDEFAPGSMIYFELAGSSPEDQQRRGVRLLDHLAQHAYTVSLAVSLGNVRTLVEHPSSMTHATVPVEEQAACGIHAGGVRLSLGLEDSSDIVSDLSEALAVVEDEFATVT
jgi:cystathionine beta-lyase/cystathionine gamma-synthase